MDTVQQPLMEPNASTVCASAPGKVILFGEHAVVYGEPAVAAALSDLRIFVQITPTTTRTIRMVLPDLPSPIDYTLQADTFATLNLATPPTSKCAAQIHALFGSSDDDSVDTFTVTALTPLVYLIRLLANPETIKSGMEICVRSQDLPVGAGLGSSAAFGVASAAALVRLQQNSTTAAASATESSSPARPDAESLHKIDQYAFYSEILLHGTPSGIDNAVSSHGGALHFTKRGGKVSMTHLVPTAPLELLLVYTHVPRSTKQLVEAVGNMQKDYPAVRPMLQAMGLVAEQFQTWWSGQDDLEVTDVLTLVRTNQLLLKAVGVSHPSLDRICSVVDRVAGDQAAAKLTGAGGGGCAFVVLQPSEPGQLDSLRAKIECALKEQERPWKFTCLKSSVGGDGVLWLSPRDFPKAKVSSRWTAWTHSTAILSIAAAGTFALLTVGLQRSSQRR